MLGFAEQWAFLCLAERILARLRRLLLPRRSHPLHRGPGTKCPHPAKPDTQSLTCTFKNIVLNVTPVGGGSSFLCVFRFQNHPKSNVSFS